MSKRGAQRQSELFASEQQTVTGAPRAVDAHLPGDRGGPEFYALCPGCEVHPDGGTFPMAELARAEGCPTGRRLAAGGIASAGPAAGGSPDAAVLPGKGGLATTSFFGERECRWAGREGPARPGTERRDASLPSPSPFLFYLTAPWRLGEGLVSDLRRRVSRNWYFRRRRAICRRRLSQIVSDPYWTS